MRRILTAIVLAAVMATSFFGGQASALTASTATETQKAQAFLNMRALQACVRVANHTFSTQSNFTNESWITPENAASGLWFNKQEVGVGGFDSSTGNIACSDTAWLKRAIAMFGWTDPKQALRDLGFAPVPPDNNFAPINGNNDFNNDNFETVIEKRWGGQLDPTPMGNYLIYRAAFVNICGAAPTTDRDIANGTGGMILKLPQPDGSIKEELFKLGMQKGDVVTISATKDSSPQLQISCQEIGQKMQSLGPQVAGAIKAGATLETIAPPATSGSGTVDDKETCAVDGIGWIVCPVAGFLGKITDGAYAMVEQLLVFQISTDPFSTDPAVNPVFPIWSSIRNTANVAFIVALFVVIFSQATSIGLSNYGIKKMLPRIIAAAILVNLSYYLCIFAIDVSNILGAGMDGIVKAPLGALGAEGDTWEATLSGVLMGTFAGVAIGAAAYFGVLALALPMLVAALLAIVTAIIVLVARHALLIMLIVVSPLAFVAYILPNTENLFDKWRKTFTTLLVLYPLVAIVFSGSQVAAAVMRATAPAGFTGAIITILSLAVMAIPLFALPFLVKFSGGVLGRVAGMVNNPNKGLIDRTRKSAEGHVARNRGKYAADYDPNRTGSRKLQNLRARGAKPFLGVTKAGRDRSRFALSQMGDNYEAEETKLASATISQRGISGDKYALYDLAKNTNNDHFLRRAAANQLGSIGASDLLENLYRGEVNASGARTGVDESTKRLAAKAIGNNADKLASAAQPLFFDAVTYESKMKALDNQKAVSKVSQLDEAYALNEARNKGAETAQSKVTAQMGPQYLANLKADQIIGARKVLKAASVSDPSVIQSTKTAIASIAKDQRVLSNMTDEQVVEVGKMALDLGISTADIKAMVPGPAGTDFAKRYENAAKAYSASKGLTPGVPVRGEMPPKVSTTVGNGWD